MRPSPVVRRRAGALVLAAVAVALVWLLLSGGGESERDRVPVAGATTRAEESPAPAEVDEAAADLVDEVLLVGFEGTAPDEIVGDLKEHPYGGVLIATANWEGAKPGKKLIAAIRDGAEGSAPLIATDQEGGAYRTLTDLPPEERQLDVGDRGDPKVAKRWAEEMAQALAGVGVDLNLGPIADVATLDTAIADRSFGDDPELVADMTAAAVEGCADGGVACAIAHFPGLGAAAQSTDVGPAQIGLDPATLAGRDLVPFEAGFKAGAPAVVVSHGLFVAYDSVTPASLSPEIVTGLLREDLGFRGVAISDDVGAGAIAAVSDPGAAAVAAIDAGIDLVQVGDPGDVKEVREALAAAVASGELSEKQLRTAAGRVARLREALNEDGKDEDAKDRGKDEKKAKGKDA